VSSSRRRMPESPSNGSTAPKGEARKPEAQLSFEQRFAPPPKPAPAEAQPSPAADAAKPAIAAVPGPPAEPRVLKVVELVRAARQTLEARFGDLRVEGEVSGCKRSANGHFYFTLKDAEAQIDCVMYNRDAGRLKFRLADGQMVRCRGKLTIYEGRGRFQLQVSSIEPAGAGALALAFEALKQKLSAEGLFESSRKRPLPFLPRRIGVVSSRQGAVIRDIVRVAHRRYPVPILLAPAPVQGEGAAALIALAIVQLCQVPDVDVIIIARGGGSMEDLWAFNDEKLARTIAACPLPTISAVGHETDFTIADFVADVRAPTPSAAAELAVPVAAELLAELRVHAGRLARGLLGEIRNRRLTLERGRARLGDPRRIIDERRQILDDASERAARALRGALSAGRKDLHAGMARLLRAHPQRRIADQRLALGGLERRLAHTGTRMLSNRRHALEALASKLDALSPLKVLDRGYSLARTADGKVVRSCDGLAAGQPLMVTLHDGDLDTRIEEVRKRGPVATPLPPEAPTPSGQSKG
jgi:exodeoxyribonuclease VII large subunit